MAPDTAALAVPCPACDAVPGQMCWDKERCVVVAHHSERASVIGASNRSNRAEIAGLEATATAALERIAEAIYESDRHNRHNAGRSALPTRGRPPRWRRAQTHAVCPPCREGWGHWNGHEYVPTVQSKAAAPLVPVSHECYGDRHDDCAWPRCECGCHRGH